nr:uncharacterized protein LOC123567122 [Macaca fascicularis]
MGHPALSVLPLQLRSAVVEASPHPSFRARGLPTSTPFGGRRAMAAARPVGACARRSRARPPADAIGLGGALTSRAVLWEPGAGCIFRCLDPRSGLASQRDRNPLSPSCRQKPCSSLLLRAQSVPARSPRPAEPQAADPGDREGALRPGARSPRKRPGPGCPRREGRMACGLRRLGGGRRVDLGRAAQLRAASEFLPGQHA